MAVLPSATADYATNCLAPGRCCIADAHSLKELPIDTDVVVEMGCSNLKAGRHGLSSLASLNHQVSHYRNSKVRIDCNGLEWIDAHLAAPMMTIVRHCQLNGNKITFRNLAEPVQKILRKNGFLSSPLIDNYNTTIPLTEFRLTNGVDFSRYAKRHLDRREMPKMTPALRSKIFEAFDELFENCSLHSRSLLRVCAGGQFYPRKEVLSFVISDGGQGIKGAMMAAGKPPLDAEQAIDWALKDGNTTRQGDIPGGLGLKVLRDFVRINGGRLLVVSNDGYWSQNGAGIEKRRLQHPFPGTSVLLDIVTSDRNTYDLRSAQSAHEIW